jgi:hypothetical protein
VLAKARLELNGAQSHSEKSGNGTSRSTAFAWTEVEKVRLGMSVGHSPKEAKLSRGQRYEGRLVTVPYVRGQNASSLSLTHMHSHIQIPAYFAQQCPTLLPQLFPHTYSPIVPATTSPCTPHKMPIANMLHPARITATIKIGRIRLAHWVEEFIG